MNDGTHCSSFWLIVFLDSSFFRLRAVYSDEWCSYVSIQMHEVGKYARVLSTEKQLARGVHNHFHRPCAPVILISQHFLPGHNLGLGHSGEDGQGVYGDQSGYMVSFLFLFILVRLAKLCIPSFASPTVLFSSCLYFRGTDMAVLKLPLW